MDYPWDIFFKSKLKKIFTEKKSVVDIGAGLRILKDKGNRYEPENLWLVEYLPNIKYLVLDPVPTYNPDIIGDIHHLPFADNSQDALVCMSVLEHVENPILAFQEMYRVLKPGGYCFIYVPFLYYYHARKGYYPDYWRLTKDTLMLLSKDFATAELCGVRGAIGTVMHITPLGRYRFFTYLAYLLDTLTGKIQSNQVSGYHLFLMK